MRAAPSGCRNCGGSRVARLYELSRFDVHACADCTVRFRYPLPTADETVAMYEDERYQASQYFRAPDEHARGGGWLQPRSPELRIFERGLVDLAALGPGGRLLDVGCARGTFLELARAVGWGAEGVELSTQHVAAARARGLTVWGGDFLAAPFPPASFQAITMWDFLEHVADPRAVVAHATRLLRPGGVLLVFTIDSTSLFNLVGDVLYRASGARVVRPLELLYDARHNYYFTPTALGRLLADATLPVVRRRADRAYLGRWVSEPAPAYLLAGGFVLDLVSLAVRRPYRRTLYGRRPSA